MQVNGGTLPIRVIQQRTHGGNLWELIRQYGFSKDGILDFSVDLNPLGFPNGVVSVIVDHVEDIGFYPDPTARELCESIAAYHQLPIDRVLPGNGTAELLTVLTQWRSIKRALVVVPTFGEYQWIVERSGATTVFVPTTEEGLFQLDVTPERWRQLLEGVDVMFLCNPNNPTGVLFPKEEILQVARSCEDSGTLLVVDEAFMEFVESPCQSSVISEMVQRENLVVLRSLTKFFAVPGLRIGYLVGSPWLVEKLRAIQQPWPLNTFALAVGRQLFQETEYAAQSRCIVIRLREAFQRSLRHIPGLRCFESEANFILCKIEEFHMTSSELCERLVAKGILIRNCDSFLGLESGRFIRFAVRSQHDNDRLVEELTEILRHAG